MKLKDFVRESRGLLIAGVASPFLLFPSHFPGFVQGAAAFALLVFCLARLLKSDRRLQVISSLLLPPVLLAVISLAVSVDFQLTLHRVYSLELGCAIFVLTCGLSNTSVWVKKAWTHLFLTSVLLLGLTGPLLARFRLPEKYLNFAIPGEGPPAVDGILDANILGCLLAIALALAVGIVLGQLHRCDDYPLLIAMIAWGVLAAILLFLTQSRGSIIGMLAAFAIMSTLIFRRFRVLLSLTVIVGGFSLWWWGSAVLWSLARVTGTLEPLTFRIEIWERARYAIQDFPFTGIGAGTFQDIVSHLYPLMKLSPSATPYHSHNLYLQVALDLGIGGLVAFITLTSFGIILGVMSFRSGQKFALGWIGGLLVVLTTGLLDSPLWLNKPNAVIFFLLGMLVMLYLSQMSESAEDVEFIQSPIAQGALLLFLWGLFSLASIALLSVNFDLALAAAVGGGSYLGWEWYRFISNQSYSPSFTERVSVQTSR